MVRQRVSPLALANIEPEQRALRCRKISNEFCNDRRAVVAGLAARRDGGCLRVQSRQPLHTKRRACVHDTLWKVRGYRAGGSAFSRASHMPQHRGRRASYRRARQITGKASGTRRHTVPFRRSPLGVRLSYPMTRGSGRRR